MTLAVGTTLHNGTYVIDAWVAEDAVGPMYLAMDVPRGQWIQLRVLGSLAPQALPDAADRQTFYQYLGQVADLKNSTFPARLGGLEEEGVCYQILSIPPGAPLDRLVTTAAPLPARPSLALVRQLIQSLQALRPLGWTGLRLTPDQVWYSPEAQTTTFVGFDLVPPAAPAPANTGQATADEGTLVQGLSYLLYFLLTGQRAEATKSPLAVEVRRCQPSLPASFDRALELGHPQPPTITLAEWEALLPATADLPSAPLPDLGPVPAAQCPEAASTEVVARDRPWQTVSDQPLSSHWTEPQVLAPSLPQRSSALALVLTGLMASVSGLGVGLYARLQPANSTGQERLSPNQSFPPLPDWNSNTLWEAWEDAPARRSRPDYGDPPQGSTPAPEFTPNPQEPAAPPPAMSQPSPAPAADPEPPEVWESPAEPWTLPDPLPPPVPGIPPAAEPAPVTPPTPLEPPRRPDEGAAPPPLTAPPIPNAPAPASS
ncbi:MAG: hypothetical protein ACFCVB_07415 [Nodosilinea sp.]